MRFTVQLAPDEEPKTKRRSVRISKAEVFKDIDLYTHKTVDGSQLQDPRQRNAIQSDVSEGVDGAVLARHVEFRNAQLRARIQFALVDNEQVVANDELGLNDAYYFFHFEVTNDFKDIMLRPLAEYIHRFLVFGALYDWYAQFDMNQAGYYGKMASDAQDEIGSILAGPAIVKRPLQPFGPAEKIY